MNEERDKFLTRAMNQIWHDSLDCQDAPSPDCIFSECVDGLYCYQSNSDHNFSSWQGFGKLWEWVVSKTTDGEEYEEFIERLWFNLQSTTLSLGCDVKVIPRKFIHPDRFADAVYEFLSGKKDYEGAL
jgi:hypothetical protein